MIQDPVGGVLCLPGKKGGHDPGTDNPDCGERVVGACRKVLGFLSPHTKVHVSPEQAKTTCLLSWSWGGWISFPFLSFFLFLPHFLHFSWKEDVVNLLPCSLCPAWSRIYWVSSSAGHFNAPFMFSAHIRIISSWWDFPGLQMATRTSPPRGTSIEILKT